MFELVSCFSRMSTIARAVYGSQRLRLVRSASTPVCRIGRQLIGEWIGQRNLDRACSNAAMCNPGQHSNKWNSGLGLSGSRAPFSRTTRSHRFQYRAIVSNELTKTFSNQLRRCSNSSGHSSIMTAPSQRSPRLPVDVKPTHYDVTVRTDLEKLVFDGWATIE